MKNKATKKPTWSRQQADFYQTTWRYNSEDGTLHNHWCENLKFNKIKFVLQTFSVDYQY
jgi:hypothetical protein